MSCEKKNLAPVEDDGFRSILRNMAETLLVYAQVYNETLMFVGEDDEARLYMTPTIL
ncbi:MAG: hypothetical protein ACLRSW_10720 [Christensenellaceae bacterium]